jgi:hypothetical protein
MTVINSINIINNTGTDYLYDGIPFPAYQTINIDDDDIILSLANNDSFKSAVTSGNLALNDGSSNLDAAEGLKILSRTLDVLIKASANDQNEGYLSEKINVSSLLSKSISNVGNNESINIDIDQSSVKITDESSKISNTDTTAAFLEDKIQAGNNITITKNNSGNNETLTIASSASIASEDMPIAQVREDGPIEISSSNFVDFYFDTLDIENNTSILEWDDSNKDRLLIKQDGLYYVEYESVIRIETTRNIYARLRRNDAEVLDGTEANYNDISGVNDNYEINLGRGSVVELCDGDFITLQHCLNNSTSNNIFANNVTLKVIKLQGAKGDKGDTGAGSSVGIKDSGNLINNTPHSVINFGDNIDAQDQGNGEVLITASGSVFGSQFQKAESLNESSTSSTSYQEKLQMVTGNLPSGTYRIGWSYNWSGSSTSRDIRVRLHRNNSEELMYHSQEPKDSGTDQQHPASGFIYKDLSGTHEFDLDFKSENNGTTVWIRDARLEIWRVS